jgi:hypothetical protein
MTGRFSKIAWLIAGVAAAWLTVVLLCTTGRSLWKNHNPGDGLFYEITLPGTGANCIFVQLPPSKASRRRNLLWERINPFQARFGMSSGPVSLTRLMKDVSGFGGIQHLLVTENLFREYGHDPVEFLPPRFSYGTDYGGSKTIDFPGAAGPRQQVCARVWQSLTNVGITVVTISPDIALLVPQPEAGQYKNINPSALRRREGAEIKVPTKDNGGLVRLELSREGGRWMPYSPPFTNFHQFDTRVVVDYGRGAKWRVHPFTEGSDPP